MNLHEILEEGGTVVLFNDSDHRTEELEGIAQNLAETTYLVPGFIPADAGFLNINTLILDQFSNGIETYVLPDRNVVTRMAKIARAGAKPNDNGPEFLAANLMALAQVVEWQIDPSIAFHELAHRKDNATASEELSWFCAANKSQPRAWIEIALGRSLALDQMAPIEVNEVDWAEPLLGWQRNYAVCLKTAELELSALSPFPRIGSLLNWMDSEFSYFGSAALFAVCYFGPSSARAGMLKNLRSPNRERAIAGIKNAAWDVSYLSCFTSHVRSSKFPYQQYVLATADKTLANVAQLLILRRGGSGVVAELEIAFTRWWPKDQARQIAVSLIQCQENAAARIHSNIRPNSIDSLTTTISNGEDFILEGRR
jgi:hypothetical protein